MAHRTTWTPEARLMLGKVPDSEIANQRKISISAVGQMRKKLGIPPFHPRAKYHHWTAEEVAMLGQQPDAVVARALGRKRKSIMNLRKLLKKKVCPLPKINEIIANKIEQS